MGATPHSIDRYLTEREVAAQLAVSVNTLRSWRFYGRGPRWVKLNFALRYSVRELEQWLATRPAGGEVVEAHRAETRP